MNLINPVDLQAYLSGFPEHTQVVPAYMFQGRVEEYFHNPQVNHGSRLPWSKTHGKISLRPGEVSIWAGFNGSGKSLLTGQMILGVMGQNEPACIASMEMKPEVTMARLCRQASGSNLPSQEFIKTFHQWTDGKLWIFTQQNTVKFPTMQALARYCGTGIVTSGKKLPMKHLVIDSLMKCGIKVDDYNTQKDFIDSICSIAKDTGLHIHLVCHMRKGDTEFKEGDKMDIKGASELSDQVDNVFILWRNKAKEDESSKANPKPDVINMPDALLSCRKQRHGEWEGKINLWFHKASMQYVGFDKAPPIDFVRAA